MLGGVAGLIGVILAALGVLALAPTLERYDGIRYAGVDVRPLELLGIASFGVVAAVLAALLPARVAARMPVMAALSGRYEAVARKPHRRPIVGVVLIALGVLAAVAAPLRLRSVRASFSETVRAGDASGVLPPNGEYWVPPSSMPYLAAMVGGICLVVAGLLVGTPALLALASRMGRYLPVVPRLALRDAGRHRHRTAPAVCAIALVVGGTLALGFSTAGDEEADRALYIGQVPYGMAYLQNQYEAIDERTDEAAADVANQLGGQLVPLTSIGFEVGPSDVMDLGTGQTAMWEQVMLLSGVTCDGMGHYDGRLCAQVPPNVIAGTIDQLAEITGAVVPEDAREALADGGAVVLGHGVATEQDRVTIGSYYATDRAFDDPANPQLSIAHELPAMVLDVEPTLVGAAFVTPETAAALEYEIRARDYLIALDDPPSEELEEQARAAGTAAGLNLDVERGYESDTTLVMLLLSAISGLITTAGVAMAIGLAAAEGRVDLATLGAIGAPPRRRRALAMGQAAVIAMLGTSLGVGLGVLLATGSSNSQLTRGWAVPWSMLAIVVLGVPALAMIVAGVFTRSRLPMVRRMA